MLHSLYVLLALICFSYAVATAPEIAEHPLLVIVATTRDTDLTALRVLLAPFMKHSDVVLTTGERSHSGTPWAVEDADAGTVSWQFCGSDKQWTEASVSQRRLLSVPCVVQQLTQDHTHYNGVQKSHLVLWDETWLVGGLAFEEPDVPMDLCPPGVSCMMRMQLLQSTHAKGRSWLGEWMGMDVLAVLAVEETWQVRQGLLTPESKNPVASIQNNIYIQISEAQQVLLAQDIEDKWSVFHRLPKTYNADDETLTAWVEFGQVLLSMGQRARASKVLIQRLKRSKQGSPDELFVARMLYAECAGVRPESRFLKARLFSQYRIEPLLRMSTINEEKNSPAFAYAFARAAAVLVDPVRTEIKIANLVVEEGSTTADELLKFDPAQYASEQLLLRAAHLAVELGTVASRAYATSVVDLLTSSDIVVGDKLGALLQKDVEALRFELLERDQSNSDRWKQMIETNAAALEAVQTIPVPTPELPPVRVKPVVTAAVDDDDTAAITAEGDGAVELEPTPVKDPVIFPVARPVIPLMQ